MIKLPNTASGKDGESEGKGAKRRRIPELDYLGDETSGPWAMPKTVEKSEVAESIAEEEKVKEKVEEIEVPSEQIDPTMHILEPEEEDEKWEKVNESKMGYVMPPRPARGSKVRHFISFHFMLFHVISFHFYDAHTISESREI